MIQLTKEHLHDQNKKLTEENQRLELVVYSLQRQLSNLASFIDRAKLLQDQVDLLNQELGSVRRDNAHLQEVIVSLQAELNSFIANAQIETTERQEIETLKIFYEEQLNSFAKENTRLQKLIKEFNTKQVSNLQLSATKLVELGIKIDQKLDDQTHRRMLSNPIQQSPKGISKEVYQNLILQLSNQSIDEKSMVASQYFFIQITPFQVQNETFRFEYLISLLKQQIQNTSIFGCITRLTSNFHSHPYQEMILVYVNIYTLVPILILAAEIGLVYIQLYING
ncbi:unnamed protein product (macronuclear) [Paramecium tetraurelia]|uniref:Uncharacterized protein n=1 Tax=Paramecium tetraurelia TaxID=5888 RepID=A0DCG7_PARTE|nr:uncharacterized protein GSPATT00015612001 [Paramecium tetraurelia]CAK80734.1 unnamed protein product [Paramecium tetraurelia]|eukprot:XP_001448131.1 hypothetical protein (macronuclear) [Paramecium tetraurelia strain d4-2]